MSPAEVLRKAAGHIERRGWCQRRLIDECGHICLAQGLAMAFADCVESQPWMKARLLLKEALGVPSDMGLAYWNDQPGRTAEEVIAKLREVADKLEAGS